MNIKKNKVAFDEEINKRAKKIMKEEHGHDMSLEEIQELGEITAKYIRSRRLDDDFFGVYLPGLGRAYYKINELNQMKRTTKHKKVVEEKVNKMMDYFENNNSKKNRLKGFRVLHNQDGFVKMSRRRGEKLGIEEIEELQNNIE